MEEPQGTFFNHLLGHENSVHSVHSFDLLIGVGDFLGAASLLASKVTKLYDPGCRRRRSFS